MICCKWLSNYSENKTKQNKTWQSYNFRRKPDVHISWMLFLSWACLPTAFQGIKKNHLCLRNLQFKHHVIFTCYDYSMQFSKSTNALHFLWYLLYSLIFYIAVLIFFFRFLTFTWLSLKVHFICCQRDFKSALMHGSEGPPNFL